MGCCSHPVLLLFPGTLTQNEMVFKRLHLGTVAYGLDSMDEVQSHIFSIYTQVQLTALPVPKSLLRRWADGELMWEGSACELLLGKCGGHWMLSAEIMS